MIQVSDHVIVDSKFINKMRKRYGLDKTIRQSVGRLTRLESSRKVTLKGINNQ